jgi:hypothetical protein
VVFGGIRPLAYVSPCQTQGTLLESEGVSKAKDKSVLMLPFVAFALRPGD